MFLVICTLFTLLMGTRAGAPKVKCSAVVKAFQPTVYNCLNNGNSLGEGASGITFKVEADKENKVYAAKAVFNSREVNGRSKKLAQVDAEIALLESMSHPNIIGYKDKAIKGPVTMIMLEMAGKGTLKDLIKNEPTYFESIADVAYMFSGIASGTDYLHTKKKIVHADLKPDNIVVDDQYNAKLIDFDLVQKIDSKGSFAGTPSFMAPEVLLDSEFKWSPAQDVYSLGVVLYAMLHKGRLPFEAKDFEELIDLLDAGQIRIRPNLPFKMARLISHCLQIDPKDRPSMVELITAINTISNRPKADLIKGGHISNRIVPTGVDVKFNPTDPNVIAKVNKEWEDFYGKAPPPELKKKEEEGSDPELPSTLKDEGSPIQKPVDKKFMDKKIKLTDNETGKRILLEMSNGPVNKEPQRPVHPSLDVGSMVAGMEGSPTSALHKKVGPTRPPSMVSEFSEKRRWTFLVGQLIGLLAFAAALTVVVARLRKRRGPKNDAVSTDPSVPQVAAIDLSGPSVKI